ncbi:MAG TPA: response regulator transcription factor [Dehalococcoidia bacterium]|nr:response regulator transcription factor [Dehalococcoidia bacterium]
MSMRVLLVDDHALFRDGIASLLTAWGLEVVGQASDGLEAVERARTLYPDLVLMDVKMPRCNGLEATRLIKANMPQVKIVMLTVSDDEQDLFEAIKAGARGYLLKNLRGEEFMEMLSGISRGEAALSPTLASKILAEFARQSARPATAGSSKAELSEREREVLRLVVLGLGNRDIAANLCVSENTVRYHIKNILAKLHLRNRAQAAAYAVQQGLADKPSPD